MALQDRVFSLETEYAITFYAEHDHRPGGGQIVDALMQAVADSYGTRPGSFLLNGSRLAHDVGHAEWSLPECRSGRELAVYDKAADHLFIETVIPNATDLLTQRGFTGSVVVAKNNADPFGTTYGCHENYQMLRNADLLTETDFIRYIAQAMIPFLVTRQIFAGSGRLINHGRAGRFRRRGEDEQEDDRRGITYELSQRAGFIQTTVSRDTTRSRPIFNLGREGESFSTGNYRRLHQIMGDATLSGWATWVKMGSTGLLLRMIEDVFIGDVMALSNPVDAMRRICRDLSGRGTVALQDGRQVTALDIQWDYYNQADAYLNVFGATEEDEDLMEEWGKALEDFEQDPMNLRDRADWAIKKQLLDSFLAEHDLSFGRRSIPEQLATDLQAFDLRFHELSPAGLYTKLYPVDTVLSQAEIDRAKSTPPPYTRARVRGEITRLARECGIKAQPAGWMGANLQGDDLRLADPMIFDHAKLAVWDRPWRMIEQTLADNPTDDELQHTLGRCYQSEGFHQHALNAYRTAAEQASDRIIYMRDLARTLLLLGLYEEAITWWGKYNRFRGFGRGEHPPDYNELGDAYRFAGDDGSARQAYDKAVRQGGSIAARAQEGIALIYLKQGDQRSARTYLDQAQRMVKTRLVADVCLGVMHYADANNEQAQTHWRNALGLAPSRCTPDLTPEAARYFLAVAHIGLATDDALDTLHGALTVQTALAAAGIYALTPLLTLLANAPAPPPAIAEALTLAQAVQMTTDQPDPAELPVMTRHIREWLHSALAHPIKRIRLLGIEFVGWRLEDAERVSGLADFVQRLVDLAQHDPEPAVRRRAVKILANPLLAEAGVMDQLITCLHDADAGVRWAAQAGLDLLNAPVPLPPGTTIQIGASPAPPRGWPPGREPRSRLLSDFGTDELSDAADDLPF